MTEGAGGKSALVYSFLAEYYGTGEAAPVDEPIGTLTTKDRYALVNVHGIEHVIYDIGMRMLTPRELYRCQGFRDSYIIDRGHDGRPTTKTDQVRMCGNSVCPPLASALVRANLPEMIARRELVGAEVWR